MSRCVDVVAVNTAFGGAAATLATANPNFLIAGALGAAVMVLASDIWEMTK